MDRSVVLRGGRDYRPYSLFAYYMMAGKDIRLEYLDGKNYLIPKAEKVTVDYSADADSAVVVLSWEAGRLQLCVSPKYRLFAEDGQEVEAFDLEGQKRAFVLRIKHGEVRMEALDADYFFGR